MSCTVRIELHNADWDDYQTLHSAMEREGFSRTIISDKGIVYNLPMAEYNYEGGLERSDVLEKAKRASAKTELESEILVTESAGRTWSGLKKSKAAA